MARELGADHAGFVVDLASEDEVVASHHSTTATVGPVDGLVNNAATALLAPAAEHTVKHRDETTATNLRGAFLCARLFGPDMVARARGRIIQIASQNAGGRPARNDAGMINGRNLCVDGGSSVVT